MKIVFALLWLVYGGSSSVPVKVGEYEKISQCNQQGRDLTASYYNGGRFWCVPVNATVSR